MQELRTIAEVGCEEEEIRENLDIASQKTLIAQECLSGVLFVATAKTTTVLVF